MTISIQERSSEGKDLVHLPHEIIEAILSHLPTKSLVLIAHSSRLFHQIVLYLIHCRIRRALTIENFHLIYECYLPSNKYTEPYNHCSYVKTTSLLPSLAILDSETSGEAKIFPNDQNHNDKHVQTSCGKLYTHFMPLAHADSTGSISCAHTNISLDPSEFFTQMCSMAQLVKTGPRQGLFQSVVPVFENWFRLRREWLEETAAATSSKYPNGRLVWVESENIGLVVKVTKKGWVRPILMEAREEDRLPATFEVQYHELVIRTGHLLAMIEQSKVEQRSSGNAMMITFANEAPVVGIPVAGAQA